MATDGADGRDRRTLRILVVDDDAVSRGIALEALERIGHGADAATDGARAVAAAARTAYDLIFMDCAMPGLDGFEAARRIRAGEAGGDHRAHIVALTGSVTYNDEQLCFDAGMDGYLPKPVRARHLRAIIDGLTAVEG